MHHHTHQPKRGRAPLAVLALLTATFAIPSEGRAEAPGRRCEAGVASAVAGCVGRVNALTRRCYAATGAACAAQDPAIVRALGGLERTVLARCAPDATAQA
ncbi:hypothetical protein K2Z84_31265, partial [Candidatus Binatia bacterium]|nr:hypothetical protein [Candidatus Binatia bacterium]